MVIKDQEYLELKRKVDTLGGMSGSYLQRTWKALEIIAQNLKFPPDVYYVKSPAGDYLATSTPSRLDLEVL